MNNLFYDVKPNKDLMIANTPGNLREIYQYGRQIEAAIVTLSQTRVTPPTLVTFWKGPQNDAINGCKEVSVPRRPFSEF